MSVDVLVISSFLCGVDPFATVNTLLVYPRQPLVFRREAFIPCGSSLARRGPTRRHMTNLVGKGFFTLSFQEIVRGQIPEKTSQSAPAARALHAPRRAIPLSLNTCDGTVRECSGSCSLVVHLRLCKKPKISIPPIVATMRISSINLRVFLNLTECFPLLFEISSQSSWERDLILQQPAGLLCRDERIQASQRADVEFQLSAEQGQAYRRNTNRRCDDNHAKNSPHPDQSATFSLGHTQIPLFTQIDLMSGRQEPYQHDVGYFRNTWRLPRRIAK